MIAEIGERLRDARRERGITLRSLAQDLKVSASLISQVENGKTQPSVSTLYAMVSYLGVSLDELLGVGEATTSPQQAPVVAEPDASGVVQRAGTGPVLEMENGVHWERLAAHPGGAVDPLLVTYDPGACSSVEGKMMRHSGVEHAYLLEGELTVQVDFDTVVLRAGDSLQFDSVRPHMYTNHGTAKARGIWFVVGRREQAAGPPAAEPAAPSRITSAVDVLTTMDRLRPTE
ncbi:helix-turn-helix domain-containing protein [Solicola sp. PLA-1-18]|uniref:helix-turn-helix domain-containing protein n=1 Tax=Solicola sp. PLA-1-18 TaxID=3380532 RepID=UPI003B7BEDDE